MKKLLIALSLCTTTLIHSAYISGPGDEAIHELFCSDKDDRVLATLAKIYMCHRVKDRANLDFYIVLLQAIVDDEPMPD